MQYINTENLPPIVYKFRNWNNDHHKRIITHKEAWLAHPHSLREPADIRPPYSIVADHVDWLYWRAHFLHATSHNNPFDSDTELLEKIEVQMQAKRDEVAGVFAKDLGLYMLDQRQYDELGVFSCCTSADNNTLWSKYDFAVGFRTSELAKLLQCSLGYIDYNDTAIPYYTSGDNDDSRMLGFEMFQKSTKWKAEQEFRFLKTIHDQRWFTFPRHTVDSIIVSPSVHAAVSTAASFSLAGIPVLKKNGG